MEDNLKTRFDSLLLESMKSLTKNSNSRQEMEASKFFADAVKTVYDIISDPEYDRIGGVSDETMMKIENNITNKLTENFNTKMDKREERLNKKMEKIEEKLMKKIEKIK